jgi:hypothetical protein
MDQRYQTRVFDQPLHWTSPLHHGQPYSIWCVNGQIGFKIYIDTPAIERSRFFFYRFFMISGESVITREIADYN